MFGKCIEQHVKYFVLIFTDLFYFVFVVFFNLEEQINFW